MAQHFKPERNDVPPAGRPPDVYRRFLTRVGGVNPYGEPRYRLVLAQSVLVHRGGIWHDWPENTSVQDQGGLQWSERRKQIQEIVTDNLKRKYKMTLEVPESVGISAQQPLRVVREMRWIPRYPHLSGWILQHWDPASLYGTRESWENLIVPGGPPRLQWLGDYPEHGAYELSCEWYDPQKGFCRLPGLPQLPPYGLLERSIQQRESAMHKHVSANAEWRRLTRLLEWQEQQEAEKRKRIEMLQKMYRDVTRTVFGSSLAAGRLREQLAKRANERGAGISEHVGN